MKRFAVRFLSATLTAAVSVTALCSQMGCPPPNQAAIPLRAEIDSLKKKLAALDRQRAADVATIAALQSQRGTLATLPEDRLEKLYTVHGIRISGHSAEHDGTLKIYVVPFDEQNEKLKAGGTFTVQAYDLQSAGHPMVGEWHLDNAATRDAWYGGLLGYTYVLNCPLQELVTHAELTVRVSFTDELTQREFSEQKVIRITPRVSSATGPTTHLK